MWRRFPPPLAAVASVRKTTICGFPGITHKDFKELFAINIGKFARYGFFILINIVTALKGVIEKQ